MKYLLSLLGIAFSIAIIKYREPIGDMFGEQDWMQKVGGVYNVIVLTGILIFFWCIAELTGTRDIFFAPLTFLIPGGTPESTPELF